MCTRTTDETRLARLFLFGLAAAAVYSAAWGTAGGELALIPCPFRGITGVPCPGCGMTRSLIALSLGDFSSAWEHHPLGFGLLALAIAVSLLPGRLGRSWARLSPPLRTLLGGAGIAGCLALWIGRTFVS